MNPTEKFQKKGIKNEALELALKLYYKEKMLYTKSKLDKCISKYGPYHQFKYEYNEERFFLNTDDKRLNDKPIFVPSSLFKLLVYEAAYAGESRIEFPVNVEVKLEEEWDSWEAPFEHGTNLTTFKGNANVYLNKKAELEIICKGETNSTGWQY